MDEWTAEPINWMSLPVDVVGLMLAAMNVKQTSMFLCASKTFQSLYGYRFLKELGFPIDFMNKRNLPLRPEIAGYGTVCGRIATSRPRLRRLRVTDHPATKHPLFGTMLKTLASISSSLSVADLYSGFFDSFVDSFDAAHLEALYIVLGSYHSILRFLTRPLPKLRVLSIRNLDTARGLPLLNIAATTTKSLQLIYLEFKDRVYDSAAIKALTQANLDTLRRVILRLETDSAQRNIGVIKPTDCTHNWAGFDATCQNLYGVPVSKLRFESSDGDDVSVWDYAVEHIQPLEDQITPVELAACQALFERCYPPHLSTPLERYCAALRAYRLTVNAIRAWMREWVLSVLLAELPFIGSAAQLRKDLSWLDMYGESGRRSSSAEVANMHKIMTPAIKAHLLGPFFRNDEPSGASTL